MAKARGAGRKAKPTNGPNKDPSMESLSATDVEETNVDVHLPSKTHTGSASREGASEDFGRWLGGKWISDSRWREILRKHGRR
jgi:hypothetical protein